MAKYASFNEIGEASRNMIRDFPKFFEATYAPLPAATVQLDYPMVASLEVRSVADNTEVTDFSLDYRNGILKLPNVADIRDGIHVYGYHYEWFLPDDLSFYARYVFDELMFDSDNDSLADMSETEQSLLPLGTTVYALWSLVTEFSTDIDVSTPEGVMIPAHMRFQQVLQLFQYWKQRYEEKSAAMNLGPNKISQYRLRRISRMTNRYVPVFRGREIDDPRWPVRVFPEIPEIVDDDTPDSGGALVNDYGLTADGWESFGQSGG